MKLGRFLCIATVAALTSGGAMAAPVVQLIGIQDGVPGSNCGSGLHSAYVGGNVAELTFDGINSSVPTSCSGGTEAGPPANYGALGSQTVSTALGTIGLSGSGQIVSGTNSGVAATPWADNTPYLVVGVTPSTATIDLSNLSVAANYFGFYWGSVDDDNIITFTFSDNSTLNFTGANLPGAASSLSYNGTNQTTTYTNVFVDFYVTGGTLKSVTFTDTPNPAFELDNVAFGTISVPEPLSLSLLGFGLIGIGAARRRAKAA